MRKKLARTQQGTSLAELACSMIIVLPVLVAVLYVTLEASHALLIKNTLNDASREAARDLAKAYDMNAQIAADRSLQESEVLSKIKIPGIINSPAQFTVQFNDSASPPNVSVTANYIGGQWGLPPFPTVNLLKLNNPYQIACGSVYRLE